MMQLCPFLSRGAEADKPGCKLFLLFVFIKCNAQFFRLNISCCYLKVSHVDYKSRSSSIERRNLFEGGCGGRGLGWRGGCRLFVKISFFLAGFLFIYFFILLHNPSY